MLAPSRAARPHDGLDIVTPAPFHAARALLERQVRGKPVLAQAAGLQLARAKTFGLLRGGDLLVVIGFWRWPASDECFVAARPAAEIAPHMHRVMRAGRLILRGRLHSGPGRIVAFVREGNEAGLRLARIAGFVGFPRRYAPDGFTAWEMV